MTAATAAASSTTCQTTSNDNFTLQTPTTAAAQQNNNVAGGFMGHFSVPSTPQAAPAPMGATAVAPGISSTKMSRALYAHKLRSHTNKLRQQTNKIMSNLKGKAGLRTYTENGPNQPFFHRSSRFIELHPAKEVHGAQRRNLGGLHIKNGIAYPRYGLGRSLGHHMGHALRPSSAAIYGSRWERELPQVPPVQGAGVDRQRRRDRAHLAMCRPLDERVVIGKDGVVRG